MNLNWQQGSEIVGWSVIGLVASLGLFEIAHIFLY